MNYRLFTDSIPEKDKDSSIENGEFGDLNKASDDVIAAAKAKMDVVFEQTRLKPGDEGFVWDKQVEFGPPEDANDWDDDDESD